jgi:hypothetical protein
MTLDSLQSDSRGVSEVIGSILVFGLVVALVSMLQVQAVPNANEEVEFEHSNQVSNDMADLQVAVSESVDTGRTKEANVKLGADYPPRLLFFNPPSATGRMQTSDPATIRISNADADGNLGAYLQTNPELSTRQLNYTANYNELENAPVHVREAAVAYKATDDDALVEGSTLIDGRQISLVAIGGEYDSAGVQSETVSAKPLSAPSKSYQVSDTGSRIRLEVPTTLPEEQWSEILEGEYAAGATTLGGVTPSGDGFVMRAEYDDTTTPNTLLLELKQGEQYTLQLGKVGFGDGGDPTAKYIVPSTRNPGEATVEVRDTFNNPVSGVELDVEFVDANGNTVGTTTVTTGPDGTASVSQSGGAVTATFSADLDDSGSVDPTLEELETAFNGDDGPILLTDVSATSGTDTITLDLSNEGTARRVTRVQTHYVTELESKSVLESVVLAGGGPVGSLTSTSLNTTNVTDGPDAVTAIGGTSLNSNAVEGEAPGSVTGGPTVPTGTSSLSLTFDDTYVLNERGALLVEVTVFYDGGHRERYTVHLFENEA